MTDTREKRYTATGGTACHRCSAVLNRYDGIARPGSVVMHRHPEDCLRNVRASFEVEIDERRREGDRLRAQLVDPQWVKVDENNDDARADASRAGVIVWAAIGWLVFAAGVAGFCYWIGTKV